MKDRKKLEEELEVYKNRLEDAMDAGNIAWWEMELPSGKVKFNERKAKILGYSSDRFEHYSDFTDLLHPEDYEKAMKAMEDHLEGRAERYEVEYRIQKKDGSYMWFRDVGGITEEDSDEEGYKKVTGVVIDIDKRKKMEEEKDFLYSLLKHDVKNKSNVVQGYLELLKESDLDKKHKEWIERALKSSKEGVRIINKVSTLKEIDMGEEIDQNVKAIIDEVVELNVDRAEEKGMEIKTHIDKKSEVKGGSLIKEALSNLIENSINHSNGSKVRIKGKSKNGDYIVTIEDDGIGIPDDKKDKIFEKGYKEGSKGSGLGLYLVDRIVKNYGGNVDVKDSEMGGARFDVELKKA